MLVETGGEAAVLCRVGSPRIGVGARPMIRRCCTMMSRSKCILCASECDWKDCLCQTMSEPVMFEGIPPLASWAQRVLESGRALCDIRQSCDNELWEGLSQRTVKRGVALTKADLKQILVVSPGVYQYADSPLEPRIVWFPRCTRVVSNLAWHTTSSGGHCWGAMGVIWICSWQQSSLIQQRCNVHYSRE